MCYTPLIDDMCNTWEELMAWSSLNGTLLIDKTMAQSFFDGAYAGTLHTGGIGGVVFLYESAFYKLSIFKHWTCLKQYGETLCYPHGA